MSLKWQSVNAGFGDLIVWLRHPRRVPGQLQTDRQTGTSTVVGGTYFEFSRIICDENN